MFSLNYMGEFVLLLVEEQEQLLPGHYKDTAHRSERLRLFQRHGRDAAARKGKDVTVLL